MSRCKTPVFRIKWLIAVSAAAGLHAAPPTTAPATDAPPVEPAQTIVLRSPGNTIELVTPPHWTRVDGMQFCDLYIAHPRGHLYFWVYSEPKEDLVDDMTIARYVETRLEHLGSHLENPETVDIQFYTLNQRDGARVELRGEQSGRRYVCIVHVIETERRYNVIYAMGRPSRYDEDREEIDAIARSVREVQP